MAKISGRSIVAQPKYRFEKDKGRVQKVPFGLGISPEEANRIGLQGPDGKVGALGAAGKCLKCSFGNVPVIEEVVWTIPLPLTAEEALSTLGDTVNLMSGSSSVPGVASIDSTFLINGILQTDILTMGVGVHVFCEPMQFSTIGNSFAAPATTAVPPPSPDVFTANDVFNGALGGAFAGTTPASDTAPSPAVFEFGGPVWRAGWNFINAYQFQWRASQRELIINELAADVSYFGAFADAEAAGTSEVAVIEFVAAVNATYRSKGSATIFLPVSFRRVGSVNGGGGVNIGVFHPTRDFDLAPVTWGGLRFQGYGCRGQMYRQIESPCFLERGIPIGMQFIVQDAVHQALMLEAVTINNEPLGTNISPDENYSCSTTGSQTGATVVGQPIVAVTTNVNVMAEQTLDATPVLVAQSVNVCREVFKGGVLKIGIKLKGWEMPGGWKAFCESDMPSIIGKKAA
jgi:hypothetical protein